MEIDNTQNTEEQAVPMESILDTIKESFSIDPDAFAKRFDPVATKVSEILDSVGDARKDEALKDIEEAAKILAAEGKSKKEVDSFVKDSTKSLTDDKVLNDSFIKFKDELSTMVKQLESGAEVDERSEKAKDLISQGKLINELASEGDIDLDTTELAALNEAIALLVESVQPRALSTRLAAATTETAKNIGLRVEGQFVDAVHGLQGAMEGLGDEFPPLQIALQKTNELINFLVGSMWKLFKKSIARQFQRRKQAKLARLESSISNKGKKNKIADSPKRSENSVQKVQKVDLPKKTISKISNEKKEGGGRTEVVENGILFSILRAVKKGKKKDTAKSPLLMRLIPFMLVFSALLKGAIAMIAGISSAVVAGVAAISLPVLAVIGAVIGLGIILTLYGGKIVDWIGKVWENIKQFGSDIIEGLKNLGASIVEGVGDAIKSALNFGKEKLGQAKDAVVGAKNAVVSGAKSLFTTTKNFFSGDEKKNIQNNLQRGGQASNVFTNKKINTLNSVPADIRRIMPANEPLQPNIGAESIAVGENVNEVISFAQQKAEREKSDTVDTINAQKQKEKEMMQQGVQSTAATTVVNNNRSNSTYITKTDPVYPEIHYNQKSRDAFAN